MIRALLVLLSLLAAVPARAEDQPVDTLAQVLRRGELRWGMDSQGGAPYVFQSPMDPNQLVGFEVDLADALARELGVRARPVQGQWDRLLDLLQRGDFDIAMNGLEEAEEKRRVVELSRPYYVATMQLTVRTGDEKAPRTQETLANRAIGTLPGSLCERTLQRLGAKARTYDGGQNEIYDDLRIGRTDGVLMDSPVTRYYARIEPALEPLDASFGEVRYAIALRKGDDTLKAAVDAAIEKLAKDGTLRQIYERWGLWNAETARLFGQDAQASNALAERWEEWRAAVGKVPPLSERLLERYPKLMPIFARGAALSLVLSVCAMALAILLGVTLALGRAYGPKPVQLLATCYIEFFRGTPLLIQLTMIYFGLPELGVTLPPFVAGWLALGLNYAAAEAENYRAGLFSVPAGQLDAARVLGLTKWQAIRHVVAPQAVRVALPPATNDFIALLKDSSLVSLVTLTELTKTYVNLANSTRDHLGLGVMVAAWYLVVGLPFARLARLAEARMARHLRVAVA